MRKEKALNRQNLTCGHRSHFKWERLPVQNGDDVSAGTLIRRPHRVAGNNAPVSRQSPKQADIIAYYAHANAIGSTTPLCIYGEPDYILPLAFRVWVEFQFYAPCADVGETSTLLFAPMTPMGFLALHRCPTIPDQRTAELCRLVAPVGFEWGSTHAHQPRPKAGGGVRPIDKHMAKEYVHMQQQPICGVDWSVRAQEKH